MTTIGASLVITGELTSDEDVTIDGRMRGPISVRQGRLIIGERAQLRSDVRGIHIVVRGTVDGAIVASERIELHASAVVSGSLSADQVVIADTATFNGGIDMGKRTIAAKMAQYKADQTPR